MTDFVQMLRDEEARLVERLEAIRLVLKTYDGLWTHEKIITPTKKRARLPNEDSLSGQITRAAAAYLDGIGRRASSMEIAEHLIKIGVMPESIEKPGRYVSATLSPHAHFTNDRKTGGYGLATWERQEKEPS